METYTVRGPRGIIGAYDTLHAAENVAHLNTADYGGRMWIADPTGRDIATIEAGADDWPNTTKLDTHR